jgi:hypothetical protein
MADQIQSLHRHLPQPIIGDHPEFRSNRYHQNTTFHPVALILDNDQFKATVEGADSKEAIALLVADFLSSTEKGGHSRFSEPEAAARMELLISKCDPERVAMHFLRSPERNRANDTLAKIQARAEPWVQQLTQLFINEIAPRVKVLIEARKDNAQSHNHHGHEEVSVGIPESGATVMLLEARKELKNLLENTDVQGEWLNRPQVWDAVRNTSLQNSFIEACVRCKAFNEQKKKSVAAAAPEADRGNKLLQGLSLPHVVPPPAVDSAEATQAFHGYMDSINSARDLSSIALALRVNNTDTNKLLGLTAETVSATAKRINYSANDAYLMMANSGWREGPTDTSMALIKALNNGRWTAGDEDDDRGRCAAKLHPRGLVYIARTRSEARGCADRRSLFQQQRQAFTRQPVIPKPPATTGGFSTMMRVMTSHWRVRVLSPMITSEIFHA